MRNKNGYVPDNADAKPPGALVQPVPLAKKKELAEFLALDGG
jgi:hypothetical protein